MGNRSGKTPPGNVETQSSRRSPTGQPSHSPPTTPQINRPSQPPPSTPPPPTSQASQTPPTTPPNHQPSQPPPSTPPPLTNQPSQPPPTTPPTSQFSQSPPPGPPIASLPNPPGPSPMSRVLTVSDLSSLMRLLGNAAYHSYQLGIQLDLDPDLVRTLELQAARQPAKFLSLVLETRLKDQTSPLTLQVLADAISQPPIHNEDLAWRLKQYFRSDDQEKRLLTRKGDSPPMAALPSRDVETQLSKMSLHPPISPPNRPPHSPPTDSTLSSLASSTVSQAQSLTISDLAALMRVLGEAPCSPRELGIQLGLDPRRVDALKKEALGDSKEFLSRVLQERLVSFQTLTLQTLLHAISRPPISDQDLAWRLQRDFTSDDQQEQLWKRKRNAPLSLAMADYSDHLDSVYKNAATPPDPKGGPSPSTKFINLAVIKKEETTQTDADKFTKATLHGGIDQIMHKKEAIEMEDIFKPEEGQAPVKFVLVEGAPGVGKSTFAWELCRRRHEFKAMRAFSAVVLLRLREKRVKKISSLVDLLYHDDPDNEQAVARELRASKGENVLLILDGFDEVSVSVQNSFYLAQVIRGELLSNATVLVTSRPSARADLCSLRKPDKHLEVLGFTHELIKEYASSIFGPNTPILADFLTYISTNPFIRSMVYIPLNCTIVVEIYQENREEGRPIPQTMTQLYSELTLMRMRRHLKERGAEWESLPRKLENLSQKHPDVYAQLFSLAIVAYEGTLKQEVIFEELPAGCSTLGLMTASQQLYGSGKGSTNYNFFHLTVQEFLSAFYISQLLESEQKRIFVQYTQPERKWPEDPHYMDVVWRFVAGLTRFEGIGWELVRSRMSISIEEDTEYMSSLLVQCLYEAQEKVNFERGSKILCSPVSLFDYYAFAHSLAVSTCTWLVDMPEDNKAESLEMLACGLRSREEICGSIEKLSLAYSPTGPEDIKHLKKMPQNFLQQVSGLSLRRCELDHQTLDLLSDVVPTMTSLKCLDISENDTVEDGETVKLLQTLATSNHLHTLSMWGIPLGRDGIKALSHLIRPPGGLKELIVGDETMERDCVELLLETVLSPSSLQCLALYRLNVDMTSVSFTPLKKNCNITHLGIAGGAIGSREICCIAAALRSNTTLKCLDNGQSVGVVKHVTVRSDASQFKDSVTRVLTDALKINRSLKRLSLRACDTNKDPVTLSREEEQVLHDALQYNKTLEYQILAKILDNYSSDHGNYPTMREIPHLLCIIL